MASEPAERVAGSYNSFGSPREKKETSRTCRSQPFNKPFMGLDKFTKVKNRLMKKVCKILSLVKDRNPTGTDLNDFSLHESKLIIRELAVELDRIAQKAETQSTTEDVEEMKEPEQQKVNEEQRLKEARKVLSDWAWSLKETEQDSVCLGEDVCDVVQDLQKQWKRGKLANMLPVMDFIIWSLLQQNTQQGSIAKQWLRNKQRIRSKAALNHIPKSVWKWISKAAVEITLDPSTANPSLKVSPDRRAVKMDQIIESENNPWDGFNRSRTTYDGWWCVLGAEGYVSGRYYWEVDVRGKREWRIGVVKESAPRNGFATLNTTTGYWTLHLQLMQLMAVTSPVTKLDRNVPGRLGLFLDMEEGQVSFYDAEQKKHIYTFNVNFDHTEKIYPVFGTIETDRELIILNP
ncbi:uncharacterized protein ACJ7VT_014949 isoform 2-T2 [Polymixia lowei]